MTRISERAMSRRVFAAGTLGLAGLAATRTLARGQATPDPMASPAPSGAPLICRIAWSGGFRPMVYYLLNTPAISIYADGTVIQPAPTIAIYPPAAIQPLNSFTISQAAVEEVISRGITAGLDEPQTIINEMVMDYSTASITLAVDGKPVVSSIYGLDLRDSPQPDSWDADTANRFVAIQQFADWVRALISKLEPEDILAPEAPYTPERLELFAFLPGTDETMAPIVPDFSVSPLTWPLDRPLAEVAALYDSNFGYGLKELRCAEVDGADAEAIRATAVQGSQVSPWDDNGTLYGVLINPLLPGDSGCRVPTA